jgi:hypothetical protein
VGITEWGNAVTSLSGVACLLAAGVMLVIRKFGVVGYLLIAGGVLLFPIHLWFWQFQLTERVPVPHSYVWNGVLVQIVIEGIVPLVVVACLPRFRPLLAAFLTASLLSLLLQLFSYIYWSFGTTRNFSISLSHLDAFYFALGTLTTAGTGNISTSSETARGFQALQMGLDLLIVGIVLTIILARYTSLLSRPRVGVPRDAALTAQPAPAVVDSGHSHHASEPDHPRPDPPTDEH